ncbi:hypothetical protein GF337_16200 [candidate division KSB1 bacterium]|nr:hypothetical protein [candidate division KSB1 bacterium]
MNRIFTRLCFCICLLLLFYVPESATAQTADHDSSRNYLISAQQENHPLLNHPKNRPAFEKALRIPINVIEYPFWIMGRGLESSLQYIEHNKIFEKFEYLEDWLDKHHILIADGSQGVGSGIGPAVGLFTNAGKLKLAFSSALTTYGYQGHKIWFELSELAYQTRLDGWLKFQNRTRDNFFGFGSGSKHEEETQFQQSNINGGLEFSYATKKLNATISSDFTKYYQIKDPLWSDEPSTSEYYSRLPGMNGAEFFRLGFRITHPEVLYQGLPGAESAVDFSADYFWQLDQDNNQFDRYTLFLYQTIPLYRGDRILAIRCGGSVTNTKDNVYIPFYSLNNFGGWNSLRGYESLRFSTLDWLLMNLEYRYPILDNGFANGFAIDFVYFFDAGIPSNKIERDLSRDNVRTSYGFSIRLRKNLGVILRLNVARSDESTLIGLTLGKDF